LKGHKSQTIVDMCQNVSHLSLLFMTLLGRVYWVRDKYGYFRIQAFEDSNRVLFTENFDVVHNCEQLVRLPGVNFINMRTCFFCPNRMRSFFVSKYKQWTNLGKKCANLSLKFVVLIVGEIEQQIFFVRRGLFYWQKKFGAWNRPRDNVTTIRKNHCNCIYVTV